MRVCTLEFIALLKQKYQVVLFPVKINPSLLFRIKNKLGLGSYDAYNTDFYSDKLRKNIEDNNIKLVFLNLTNLIRFSVVIKKTTNAKVILCSHGNESGDFLHEAVRFKKQLSFSKRLFSSYALGRMLQIESFYRLHYIDMVLTVSEVESEIEKWLGAIKVFMVPRTISIDFMTINEAKNRVGFIGDLSHAPNFSGMIAFCNALSRSAAAIEVRVAGGPTHIGNALQKKFPFITYLGYLDNCALQKEAATWCLFVNLVFYYSRGVSTKLAKPLGWGLPVISTTAGRRGYTWKRGKMLIAETADEMAIAVVNHCQDDTQLVQDAKEIALSMPTLKIIMDELEPHLQNLAIS